MNNRERTMAILNYQPYDHIPIIHFGYWRETLEKWSEEGHIGGEEALFWGDGNQYCEAIAKKLGFDFGWTCQFGSHTSLRPGFSEKTVKDLGNGKKHVMNGDGVINLVDDSIVSIPCEIDHTLKDRASWEEHYKHRMQFAPERVDKKALDDYRARQERIDRPRGLNIGSLYGTIRNWLGVEGACYLYYDDEPLFDEIVNTMGDMCYRCAKELLEQGGLQFDYAHYWEDICFNTGPLINPEVFREKIGPHYRRISDLLSAHGINIISLDCDGCVDALLPIWLENGVNTMFPIEVGTWHASIAPWREKYGKELRGVGGMDKKVFAFDYAAVDAEIERLKPLVALGGYIPCPDHRIAPDAKWENVQYYTERMREEFWK